MIFKGGEIISGDSMQVYRGMDIGTAKIKPEEQEGIPHHLLDILDPHEDFSVTAFQNLCTRLIADVNARGKVPVLVGGTGLYVQSVTHRFTFSEAGQSPALRRKWSDFKAEHGSDALYAELKKRDPEYADRVHPNNIRRIIRALEVKELTGSSLSAFQTDWNNESPYQLYMIGLYMERQKLYARIDKRVDIMVEEGLIEEASHLLEQGVPETATSLQAIGYKEIIRYLKGEWTKEEAITQLKRNTRRFAKRQLTWFKRIKEIDWFDISEKAQHDRIIEKITAKWKEIGKV
jgi:tRNA dimethylallyltransferase